LGGFSSGGLRPLEPAGGLALVATDVPRALVAGVCRGRSLVFCAFSPSVGCAAPVHCRWLNHKAACWCCTRPAKRAAWRRPHSLSATMIV
jgi:hypothetical protein